MSNQRAAVVTALILERPMCVECIQTKTGLSASELRATLDVVRSALVLHTETARCDVCDGTTTVLFLDRPD